MYRLRKPNRARFYRGPYTVQIRVHGRTRSFLHDMRDDLAGRFGITPRRYVPHVRLAGPYHTPRGQQLLGEVCDTLAERRPPEFRLEGFGAFPGREVYVHVEPSERMLQLKRRVAARLEGLCGPAGTRPAAPEPLHITLLGNTDFPRGIADDALNRMLRYLEGAYDPNRRLSALRMTVLGGDSRIACEYDMVLGRRLSRVQALDRRLLGTTHGEFVRRFLPAARGPKGPACGAANHKPKTVRLGGMTGKEFERACEDVLRRYCFTTKNVGGPGDGGRDIIAWYENRKVIVECKHQDRRTGSKEVWLLHSAVVTENARCGILISTGGFTAPAQADKVVDNDVDVTDIKSAVRAARRQSVLLVGRPELDVIAERVGVDIRDDSDPEVHDEDDEPEYLRGAWGNMGGGEA